MTTVFTYSKPNVWKQSPHGTGCTVASAIAAGIAQDMPLPAAVERAQAYVAAAIRGAPGYGQGPIDHGHTVHPFAVD